MATDSRAAIIVNQGGIAPPQWISAPAVVTLLVTLFAPPVKPVGAQSLQEQVLTPPAALIQNADTTHGSPLTLIAKAGQKPFFVVPNFAPDQHPVNEWKPPDTSLTQPLTLKAVVVPPPPFQASWTATQRYAWQNPDTTRGTPETIVGPTGSKPVFNPPVFSPDAHSPLALTQPGPLGTLITLFPPPVTGGCVTWNPADKGTTVVLSNGNLTAFGNSTNGSSNLVRANIAQNSGKYYFELLVTGIFDPTNNQLGMGIAKATTPFTQSGTQNSAGFYNYESNGLLNDGSNSTNTSLTVIWSTGDTLMCAVDLGAGKIWWGHNGTWLLSGNPGTGANPVFTTVSGTFLPAFYVYDAVGTGDTGTAGFASNSWTYTVPSGFSAWPCPPAPFSTLASTIGSDNTADHRLIWQPQDTAHSTPKTLIPEPPALPPKQADSVATPSYPWVNQDTARGTPLTLLSLPPVPPPFQPSFVAAPTYAWVVQDTTRGTPETLIGPFGAKPVFVPPPPGPDQHPVNEWKQQDTSQGTPLTLRAAPPVPPPFQASFVGAPSYLWVVQDTSHGQPLTLKPPALPPPPFQASFVETPSYPWVNPDTSKGTSVVFFPSGGFTGVPGTAHLIKTGQVPNLIIPFVGTPGTAQIIKTGQVPVLTISPHVLFIIDYEFYEPIQKRPWSEPIIVRPWKEQVPARRWTTIYEDVVIMIGPKDPTEVVIATIDFTQEMVLLSETITSIVSIIATTERGGDPNPSAILSGSPSGVGTTLVQNVIVGGITGCAYGIKATVTTSSGRTLVGDTLLPVGIE